MYPTSTPVPVSINGFLIPFYKETKCPVIAELESVYFIAIFSNQDKLIEQLSVIGVKEDDIYIQKIDDQKDFFKAVSESKLRIMLDPYTVQNKTKWTEIQKG